MRPANQNSHNASLASALLRGACAILVFGTLLIGSPTAFAQSESGQPVSGQPTTDQGSTDSAPRPTSEEPGDPSANQPGQPPEETETKPAIAESQPPRPAGPDTTIWIDDQGVPRPVVGLSYDELARAWRLLEGLEAESDAPRFTREKLSVEGTVAAGQSGPDRVRLEAIYEIGLPAGGKVSVPLGFDGAVLDGAIAIDDQKPNSQFVSYNKQRGGWVAWLEGKAGDRRTIKLPLIVPLLRDGDQTLLQTNIPRALDSTLTVRTKMSVTEAFASAGTLLETTPLDTGGMRLEARGAVGEFRLGWRQATTASPSQQQLVLSVEAQIFAEIDGRSVRSEATLNIESYGGQVERFRVRLPTGATLIPSNPGQLTESQPRITLLSEESGKTNGERTESSTSDSQEHANGSLCLVTLPERTAGLVTVKIATQQTVGLGDEAEVDLAGFEVLGAVRQYGDVAIRVADDWRLRLTKLVSARRVDLASLPEPLQRPNLSTAVRYFQQPWKLAVRVTLPSNRIEATPRYRLHIKPEEAVLTTTFQYRIPGARASGFSIDLHDWSRLDPTPIEPRDKVDNERAGYSQDGQLSVLYVPLKEPASRQARVEFTSRRELSPRDELLSFRLPVAQATSHGTSELIVVVDPALELVPDAERSRRLRAAALPQDQRDPLDPSGQRTFRFRGFLPDQIFVAEKRLRPGEVDLAISSRVTLSETTTRVAQDLNYTARFEPIDQVLVTAPVDLVTSGELQFELLPTVTGFEAPPDAMAIALSFRPSGSGEAGDDRMVVEVDLPQLRTGDFTLRASYEIPGGMRSLEFLEVAQTPLISSWDVPPRTHNLTAKTTGDNALSLALNRDDWSVASIGPAGASLNLTTTSPATTVALSRRQEETTVATDARVHRSWRQTWVAGDETQQRAVFQFDSQGNQVLVDLPESFTNVESANSKVEVLLDGERVVGVQREGVQLRVPIEARNNRVTAGDQDGAPQDAQAADRRHTLELRYFEPTPERLDWVAWRPARLVADETWGESYWEVIVPATSHLANTPPGFTPAMDWGGKAGYWGRLPKLGSAALHTWAGATELAEPSAAHNRYLFSYHREPPADTNGALRLIQRRTAVVICSAVMLAIGLALLYVPALRTAGSLLAICIAAAAAGVVYPNTFLLVAQAGLLGLLLAGLAAVLSAVLHRPPATEVGVASSSLYVEPKSPGTDSLIALPMDSAHTDAPTVTAAHRDSNG